MTDYFVTDTGSPDLGIDLLENPTALQSLLARRRSIRRLRGGPFTLEMRDRLSDAIRLTPSAYNLPPWHVVLVRERRAEFWDAVERGFQDKLSGDRLTRYLDRLVGFRGGVGVALIYEDRSISPRLREAWQITQAQADAFVQQSVGMVQLSLWLALTAEGLVTSLQHWDWLIQNEIAEFAGIPVERFALSAVMPIGYADESPRVNDPIAHSRVVSHDRVSDAHFRGEPELQ